MAQDDVKIPQLLSGVADDLSHIVSAEIRLARAELKQGFSEGGRGVAMIAGALIFAIPAVTILALAGVAYLSEIGLQSSVSSIAVALVLGVIAWALFSAGKKAMNSEHLHLEKTAKNIKQDVNVLKEQSA